MNVSTKYKHRTMLITSSSTRFSFTRRDTGDVGCEAPAGSSPSLASPLPFLGVEPLREPRRRRNEFLRDCLRDFLRDRRSPVSDSPKIKEQDFNDYNILIGKWFEPRGISYWFVVIVRVKVVFRKTVVGD